MSNKDFGREECGQDLVEYGLLVALIALATVVALQNFSSVINTIWTTLTTRLTN